MVNVRAYKFSDRMLIQFFDSGERSTLRCPDCGWHGKFELEPGSLSEGSEEVMCSSCNSPIAVLSSPLGIDFDVSYML